MTIWIMRKFMTICLNDCITFNLQLCFLIVNEASLISLKKIYFVWLLSLQRCQVMDDLLIIILDRNKNYRQVKIMHLTVWLIFNSFFEKYIKNPQFLWTNNHATGHFWAYIIFHNIKAIHFQGTSLCLLLFLVLINILLPQNIIIESQLLHSITYML